MGQHCILKYDLRAYPWMMPSFIPLAGWPVAELLAEATASGATLGAEVGSRGWT